MNKFSFLILCDCKDDFKGMAEYRGSYQSVDFSGMAKVVTMIYAQSTSLTANVSRNLVQSPDRGFEMPF